MKVIIPLPSSMQSLRDKLLAHRDYASMQQNSVSALDVADIEDRIQMMSNALNVVRSCYDSDSSVEYGSYSTGDARTLIGEIGIAYRFRAYLEKNFLERDIFPEELLHVLHGSTLPGQH
jgi:hypothetical protein